MKLPVAFALALTLAAPALAGRLAGGETFFDRVPTLTRAATSELSSTYNYARYFFEVSVPTTSGEPLGALTIGIPQRIVVPRPDMIEVLDGNGRPVPFTVERSDPRTVRIVFNEPISPGNQVSVQFFPMRGPRVGGYYLFPVTAYPAGPGARAQFLSFGRIQFISAGGGRG